ncbi:hypothetical protein K1T71_014609 [Dendrolimus kikuchii]|uniref:Uncharacterized protein n=1 Tax=Dendrolimus kikuchii TaxID=765133 RepID=A0ACC1CEL8_9NEOP|nr:hypothetical protein K1T71_014609 [Dendrolimus kikuchii]
MSWTCGKKLTASDPLVVPNRTDNPHLRSNIALVLRNSTLIPFRYLHKREFVCLYCEKKFLFYAELKKHVKRAHDDITEDEIKKCVPIPRDLVKVDMSDIKCKLCAENCLEGSINKKISDSLSDRERSDEFETIESFIDHLINFHNRIYIHVAGVTPSHCLLGFYMNTDESKCHICQTKFRFFTQLSSHMIEHYSTFVCHICGRKYLSKTRLDIHLDTHSAKKLKCRICMKVFNDDRARLVHLKSVHGNVKYKCFVCQESFNEYYPRLRHMHHKHGIKMPEYKCEICFKQLSRSSSLSKHIRYVHFKEVNSFICDLCGKSFTSKRSIAEHFSLHTGVKQYECIYCDKRFRLKSTLTIHVQGHLNIKPYACTLCKAAFIQKRGLINHIRIHNPSVGVGTYGKKLLQQLVSLQRGVRTDNTHLRSNIALILKNSTIIPFQHLFKREFGCLYCEKKFWFYPELKKHVESAHGDITEDEIIKSVPVPQNLVKVDISDIKCKLCMNSCFRGRTSKENTTILSDRERSINFETIESFVDHLVKFHKRVYMHISRVTPSHGLLGLHMGTDEIKCHICQKTFRIFTQLSSHMNEHYSSFICQICGKRLLSKVRLDNHMNKHNTEIFKCELCGKVFGQRSTKLQHLRRVHGDQKYECFICHEIFAKYNQRLKHLEEKHDIKNPVYKCDYCLKQLPSASSFNKHIKRNHHIKNDYICDVCGKSFTSKYSIADHLTIHTGVKNYQCKYCDKRFRARSTLKLHVQGHLNIKPFACTLCKAAFIQKHCLKNHIRVHHPSVDISSEK